jgi:hypothetical protein
LGTAESGVGCGRHPAPLGVGRAADEPYRGRTRSATSRRVRVMNVVVPHRRAHTGSGSLPL